MKKILSFLAAALLFSQATFAYTPPPGTNGQFPYNNAGSWGAVTTIPIQGGGTGGAVFNTLINNRINTPGGQQNATQITNNDTANLSNGTDVVRTFRNWMYVPQYAYNCRIGFVNASYAVSGAVLQQSGPGNAITLKAGLEYNGITVLATFQGQTAVSVPNGGEVFSDPVQFPFPAGSQIFERHSLTVTSGQFWNNGKLGGSLSTYTNGSDLVSGTGALATGVSGGNTSGIHSLKCSTYPLTSGSGILVADSIGNGTGDQFLSRSNGITGAGGGWFVRAFNNNNNLNQPLVYQNEAVNGSSVGQWLQYSNPSQVAEYCAHTFATSQLGNHDLNNIVAIQKANYIALWTQLAACGEPVFQGTILPETTSVNKWRDVAGQSPVGFNISAATNTSPIAITTSGTNGMTTGQTVPIFGVGGNTAANGSWVVTVTGFNSFTLNGSTGNGAYTSGGVAATTESNREVMDAWIRTIPAPLTGVVDVAATVEVNSANVPTLNGGFWKTSPAAVTSTATSTTSTTLTDTTQSWTASQWIDSADNVTNYQLYIASGTCNTHVYNIKSNTATAVTFASDGCTPDSTSSYEIRQIWTIDGVHPSPESHLAMSVPMTVIVNAYGGRP